MKEYKKPINERVTQVINLLLKEWTLTSLASELGVTQPKLSEILASRTAAGLDVISGLCIRFSVSPDWILLGLGGIFRDENKKNEASTESVPRSWYDEKCGEVALLRAELSALKEAVSAQSAREGAASSIGSLEPVLT